MKHTLILLIGLLLAWGNALAYELDKTGGEQRVLDDAGEVVATYPQSSIEKNDGPGGYWTLRKWEIITDSDWWAVAHNANYSLEGEGMPPPYWGWHFVSHELHIAGESWELPESYIKSVDVGATTVTATVTKFSEQFKWWDEGLTTLVLDREFPDPEPEPEPGPEPEPEPEQLAVEISPAIQLRFETVLGATYSVQKWDSEAGKWSTIDTVTGTGEVVETYVQCGGANAMLRVTQALPPHQ